MQLGLHCTVEQLVPQPANVKDMRTHRSAVCWCCTCLMSPHLRPSRTDWCQPDAEASGPKQRVSVSTTSRKNHARSKPRNRRPATNRPTRKALKKCKGVPKQKSHGL